MKKVLFLGVALLLVVSCGGGGGGGGSFSDVKNKFDNPTGDLGTENAKTVAAALAEKNSASVPTALSAALSVTSAVGAGGIDCEQPDPEDLMSGGSYTLTCTCANGGSLSYVVDPQEMAGAASGGECSVQYQYDACNMGGASISGTGWILFGVCGNTSEGYCFQFDGTVEAKAVFYEYCLDENGEAWFIVEVEGGVFVVKGYYDVDSGDGDWYVQDMDGTWHCMSTGGTGSCTNDGTGDTIDF